jgi:hypothetical protein
MKVLLLCGYRPKSKIGLQKNAAGQTLLDVRIEQLQAMKMNPVVVLSGGQADELLRESRLLSTCELVFDVHDNEATLFTNLKSGLKITDDAVFMIPLEIDPPAETDWKHLKTQLLREGFLTSFHAFQLADEKGTPTHHGFPLLISAVGNKVIQDLKEPKGLTDSRLRYHFSRPPLAQSESSL